MRLAALMFLVVIVTGCASFKEQAPSVIDEQFTGILRTPSSHDSKATFGWGIELPSAIKLLMRENQSSNLSAYTAQQRQLIADANYYMTSGNRVPQPSVSMSAAGSEKFTNGNRVVEDDFGINVGVKWQPDLWGRLADQQAASEQDVIAATWDLAAVNLSIQGRLLTAWLNVLEQRQLLNLYDQNYKNQKQRVELLAKRVDLGLTSTTGYDNAKLNLLRLKRDRMTTANRLLQGKRQINVLLGNAPNAELQIPLQLPALQPFNYEIDSLGLVMTRPDVRLAEARMLAAGYRWQYESLNQLPRLTLDLRSRVSRENAGELFDTDFWLSSLSASIIQPVFFRDDLNKQQAVVKARAEVAKATYYSSVLQAWSEIENIVQDTKIFAAQLSAAEDGLQSATRVERNTLDRYELGLASSFDVLTSQRNTLNASIDVIRLRVTQVKNRINFRLALGPLEEL